MDVQCTVTLAEGDHLGLSSTEAATAILLALGGDETKDVVRVSVSTPTAIVGTPNPPPLVAPVS
jgi:hypothetical protein